MVKRLFIATFVAISPLLAIAQNLITGHITDVRTGEPLIGASVIVKSEKGQGVVTDYDGNFSLQTKVEAPLTLRVEYVGYRALDVDVYDFEEPVEISLIDNANRLNEVVVLGYTQLKRQNLTGSVASVKGSDIASTAASGFNEQLQVQVCSFDCVVPPPSMLETTRFTSSTVYPLTVSHCSLSLTVDKPSTPSPTLILMILRKSRC